MKRKDIKRKDRKKVHDFHLVLPGKLKNKIISLAKRLNMSISSTALYILDKVLCILSKYNYEYEEMDKISKYQNINWDTDMHIYLDKNQYRKIKLLSDTMFAFSIAIVIRKLFEFYFKFLELSKDDLNRVEKIFRRFYTQYVKKYGEKVKNWKKNIKSKQLSGKFYCKLEFNERFTLTGFNFINSE